MLWCAFTASSGFPESTNELVDNWKKNIHLGLDLKGGSHLVLQVQMQDAFKAEAQTVIERLKDELGKQSIAVDIDRQHEPPSIQAPTRSRST